MFKGISNISGIDFSKASQVIFRNVHLDNVSFKNSDIRNIKFINSEFPTIGLYLGKRIRIYDERATDEIIKAKSNRKDKIRLCREYEAVAQVYRELQANYIDSLRYADASDFYIGEQESMRKCKGPRKRYFCLRNLYRITSFYGERYWIPLTWLSLILVLFPIILLFNGGMNLLDRFGIDSTIFINYDWKWPGDQIIFVLGDYFRAFCVNLSFVTLNRIEITERLPFLWQRAAISLEILTIIILASLFTLALRRRFRRKSF